MNASSLSASDRALIAALRNDSRKSVTELAQETGLSRTTVKARLDALKASGRIRRFTIETDVDVEGEVRAITLVELQGRMSRQVIQALSRIAGVTTVWSTNGAWDLVVDIRTDSLVRFDRILRDIREVPGVVNSESCILLAHATP
ncbi:Lrp/AsnC family transcriptional regulator [Celeribacter litoreus]|uniref:Lrp/AsnC family transcriptional regulator n=1 Tax=Celeribacter litoreus TaxID=2876714 RepID=UPI001CCBE08A|nr:Lrp/AsnC family transcriptional regulator [Celeribacter litoreus]MCA0043798.1 Lrp/AsnC family transcriptional regulator [Celeribacter litoreus]